MRIRRPGPSALIPLVGVVLLLATVACTLLARREETVGIVHTPTPYIVYVTTTPEGYVPPMTPTDTPYVIPVTATPDSDLTSTPYIVYVTATPQPFGPHNPGPTSSATSGPGPTLDLSGATLIPTPNETATAEPTFTPVSPTNTPIPSPTPTLTPTAQPVRIQSQSGGQYASNLGIAFISGGDHENDAARYQQAISAGAGWNRYPIYWNEIEKTADQYNWSAYDTAVRNDVVYGLKTNAILLGTPGIYVADKYIPRDLNQPVFSDGTDRPGGNKTINPANPWAEYVYATVNRYKPGGTLARQENWPSGAGVRVWEVWNEPDFTVFWQGNVQEYARLLKVAYLAARQADPEAQIMVGGMVWFEQANWFSDLLNIYKNDGSPVDRRYPFTMVAVHAYSSPSYSFYVLQRTEALLQAHGIGGVPIWLNETGVAVWNDYPGPTWATRPDQITYRATMEEQASYLVANATFSFLGEVDTLFHFQLYDDCGNQPKGSDFQANTGEFCGSSVCWGDALGLLRNRASNACFTHHPQPGSKRPAYAAFQTVAAVFGDRGMVPLTGFTRDRTQYTVFSRPGAGQIVTVIWDESGQSRQVSVGARSDQATLIQMDGSSQTIRAENGLYIIPLRPATNTNQPGGSGGGFMIGGPPVILIEQTDQDIVAILPLLDVSRSAALVKWRASFPSHIVKYEIYYRDDTSGANEWVKWFEADRPGEALFSGGPGRRYSFFARGLRADGTWTQDVPNVHAWTVLQ